MTIYRAGIFLLVLSLSGCVVTASSGSRAEYDDKMKIIDKDYREKKITEAEYNQLKDRASQQGKAAQNNSLMSSERASSAER